MDLSFDIKIKSDNLNKTFKITERIMDLYFKNNVTYFQFRGIRIPAQIKFPEEIQNDKKYDFTYADDKYVNSSFKISMETYYPSFDDSSTRYKGNVIRQFNSRTKLDTGEVINSDWIDQDYPPSE
jgi:hypothetical protein